MLLKEDSTIYTGLLLLKHSNIEDKNNIEALINVYIKKYNIVI